MDVHLAIRNIAAWIATVAVPTPMTGFIGQNIPSG
jgi:hypothetical protein